MTTRGGGRTRSSGIVAIVLLLALSAGQGCYYARPVSLATVTPTPRLLLRSREGVRFNTQRADGSIAPDGCRVREAYATLRVLVGDTLRLEQVEIRRLARNPEPCAMPSGAAVVIVAQSDLEMRVVQPSAERSFLAGMLIAPLVFLTFLAALWR